MTCIQNLRLTYFFRKCLTSSVLILNFVYFVICKTKYILNYILLSKYINCHDYRIRPLLDSRPEP